MVRKWFSRIRQEARHVFDIVTNEQIRTNVLQAIPFWIASLLTGLVAVGYTKLFGFSEDLFHTLLEINRWLVFLVSPCCFLLAWMIIRVDPAARGSGIPQVMAAIDISGYDQDKKISLLLSFRIMVVKIVSSLLMVMGGGAIGREGPTIQIAASIFNFVNRWTPASWPKLSPKNFILTGAAAGLAAAFNTPLGGIVFAIEELARIHFSFFRTALFTAVIIAGLTAQGILGPYLYLGYPDVKHLPAAAFAGVIVAAIVAGLAGGIMSRLILKLLRWKRTFTATGTVAYIIFAGLLFAAVAVFYDVLALGSGKELINEVLFTKEQEISWKTTVARILGPVISFNVGAAGGIFAPSLAAGASVGALLAELSNVSASTANILILAAMVGFLTGVTRSPFTSAILVLEMTDRHSVIFHLMLAAMVANIAALIIDKQSLYEHLKKIYLGEVEIVNGQESQTRGR